MGKTNKDNSNSASEYISSIAYDRRLYRHDIQASIAHVHMLGKQGIISTTDMEKISEGLSEIKKEIDDGAFVWKPEKEDLHMNIEARLFEKIGAVAGKLHTARSRNDQISVDMRMYTKDAIRITYSGITTLQRELLNQGDKNKNVILPGYTHLQRAQPVLLAHHLLAYFHMFERDKDRFRDCYRRSDCLPLGSGALAGVPYDIDREYLAKELGFNEITKNSMDAVSDRDFIVEYLANAAICMAHISRLAEELILWSSQEFNFIALSDNYLSGSSIMPQKRNPDYAELARGKTGRVYGHLMAILTVIKALPLTYNRDLQEDKEGFFDAIDTLQTTLEVMRGMISEIKFDSSSMLEAAGEGYVLATDLADYLVKKGRPFRESHGVVRLVVQYAIDEKKSLTELSLEEYRKFSEYFSEDIYQITVESSLAARNIIGATAPEQVDAAQAYARKTLEANFGI